MGLIKKFKILSFMKHIILSRICLNSPAMLKIKLFVPIAMSNVLQEVENNPKEGNKLFEPPCLLMKKEEVKFEAPALFKESDKGNTRGADINQGKYAYDESQLSTIHTIVEQLQLEPTIAIPLTQVKLI